MEQPEPRIQRSSTRNSKTPYATTSRSGSTASPYSNAGLLPTLHSANSALSAWTSKARRFLRPFEEALISDLFVPEDFEELVLEFANNNEAVGKLLRELQEPRPAGQDCIPWLGETAMKERLLRLCARGKVAINVRGMEYLQTHPGEDEDTAWRRLRPKLSLTGRHLDDVFVMRAFGGACHGWLHAGRARANAILPVGGDLLGGGVAQHQRRAWPKRCHRCLIMRCQLLRQVSSSAVTPRSTKPRHPAVQPGHFAAQLNR